MNYQQALDYLYASLPMFQRIGGSAYNKDLGPTRELCKALDNPHDKFKSIHVAGTNGKGTSAHTIEAILHSAEYKTVLYTSPHLKSFTERIRINGEPIPQAEVVDFVDRNQPLIEEVKPSFFETTVAMAFHHFAVHKVDFAVVEVGMGGRYDSTNVITPEISLITKIGLDHQQFLGDTLNKIAYEKAGIIKARRPVVIGADQPELLPVFQAEAQALKSPLSTARHYKVSLTENGVDVYKNDLSMFHNLQVNISGNYYLYNLPGVLKTIEVLSNLGYEISKQAVIDGIAHTTNLTGLKGRWQILGQEPLTICDVGHNLDGIRAIVDQLRTYNYKQLYIVLGTVNDKDLTPIFELLPVEANYYFCQANIPRAMPAKELASLAANLGLNGVVAPDVNGAIGQARKEATPDDLIFVGGSTFVVAEIQDL